MRNILKLWISGLKVIVRFSLVLTVIYLLSFPAGFLPMLTQDERLVDILSLAYFLVVIPVCLPKILEISGLKVVDIPMFDSSGGLNESAKKKQRELDQENVAEQVAASDR